MKEHKAPWECTYAKEVKSKCKPGNKPKSDQEYFEILCLCILQAGLNWGMVRKNWTKIKKGFYSFNINRLSMATIDELIERPGVYNNKNKVNAIIANAKEFQKIKKEFRVFSNFLKSLKKLRDKGTIKQLSKKFKHVGEYTAEYYLHCIGYWE
ncbi:MAG: DNA-3-methyladenine glycosylase I [Candidatus Thermoplasmatota archaeon]